MNALTVGSLFSGIGGLDLGLERAGMRVVWNSEIDPYACRVLAKHWPHVPNLGDVTRIDWSNDGLDHGDGIARSLAVDVICGGYPCQPFSGAGLRRGTEDVRHLWPYLRDAIDALRPRYVLLENVVGHLNLGFDQVLSDLADLGFDAEWSTVTACAVGAPHMRRRLFCVAYPRSTGRQEHSGTRSVLPELVDAERSGWWSTEPAVGRVAHGVPRRVDRVRGLGNAVVPAVAELIGRQIAADAARSFDAAARPTPCGTHHTTAHRAAGDAEPRRTSRTPASEPAPSQRLGSPLGLLGGVELVGPNGGDQHERAGDRHAADATAVLGLADEPVLGALDLHTQIQPQTSGGVNHKCA